jgi:RNA polymerase sigma factor (sigma-70 family)
LKPDTDEQLMLSVRDGDIDQLGVLFERHHGALFSFFMRMTPNRPVSEDLVQDVFFRILKYRRTYRDNSQFTTWMYHIARNARFDYFRKHKAEVLLTDEEIACGDKAMSHDREYEQQQEVGLLKRAMWKLAPEKREVLVLSRYQDLKYQQIADLLDCEVGTIKVRIHRALKELREIFFNLNNGNSHAM